jgi:hemoglobin/transferrin/lactoferrin receptor protein
VGSDLHRDLDQHRDMVYLRVHWEEAEMIDRARFGVMLHDQFENQDRLRSTFVTEYQEFDVRTYGMYFNVEKETDLGLFRAGVDGCWDFVDSERTDYNPSGSVQSVFVQGAVADDSNVLLGGVFFENDYPLTEHLTLNSGVRYTYSRVEADQVVDPTGPGALEIDDRYQALSGEIGLHYQWDEHLATSVTGSRAVRTPNLSDLTRFDSARTNEIETPSPGLREERFTTVQLGSRVECEQSAVEVTGYMTWIDDLIVRFPTGAVIGGANEVRKANAGSGRVWGIDLAGTQQLCTAWSTRVHGSYVIGDSRNFVAAGMTDREPVSKLPPLRGGIDLRYDHPGSSVWVEAGYTVAAKQDRLSSSDEGDTSRIPPGGTPGYQVVSIRGGCEPIENLTVLAAVENLTNEDYRLHGSGVNEPGTNAILGVRWRF